MRYIIALILLSLFLYSSSSLEEKIKQLKQADPSKRYILMNEIKKELIKLNRAQQLKTLEKLRKMMHQRKNNQNCKALKHKGNYYHKEKSTLEHIKMFYHKNKKHQEAQKPFEIFEGQKNKPKNPLPEPNLPKENKPKHNSNKHKK